MQITILQLVYPDPGQSLRVVLSPNSVRSHHHDLPHHCHHDCHDHDHIFRFEEEEEFRMRGWESNYEVRLWPKDNISRRWAPSLFFFIIITDAFLSDVMIFIFNSIHIHTQVIIMIIIIIIIMIINLIRSGRGLINMSEFESSRRLEEAIQLEPGVEYSVKVITRWICGDGNCGDDEMMPNEMKWNEMMRIEK